MKPAAVNHLPGGLLFLFAIVIALLTYQDYGVGWDEFEQRNIGLVNYNYVHNNDRELLTFKDTEHGPGFEMPLVYLERWLGIKSDRDIILMRHMATHIFLLLGGLAGYMLALRLYKSQFLACLLFIMLVFSPRTYGHSFINTKDIPFMAMLPVVMLAIQYAFEKKRILPFLLAGAVCGYMTSIRIMGVLPASFIVVFLLTDIIHSVIKKEKVAGIVLSLLLFVIGFFAILYACYPYLWNDPVGRFGDCFTRMAHYKWEGTTLLNGTFVKATELPWYYFPVWFGISNPALWLITGTLGLVLIFASAIREPLRYITNTPERNTMFFLGCFLAPVCAVIVLHSVIYDDWRHLYFVLPAFLFMAIYFLYKLPAGKVKTISYALCVVQVVAVGITMVRIHPFHQVYFNSFVSHRPEYLHDHYELDYWGCSYKQALDHLTEKQHFGEIKVYTPYLETTIFEGNLMMLQGADRARIRRVDRSEADYFITNYRWHPDKFYFRKPEYKIKVFNSTILDIYKLR